MAFVCRTKWPFATAPRADSIRLSVEFILHNYLLCDYWNGQIQRFIKNGMVLPLRWTVLNEIQVILLQIFIALSDGRASKLNTPTLCVNALNRQAKMNSSSSSSKHEIFTDPQ